MAKNDSFTIECNGKATRKTYNLKLTKQEIDSYLSHFPDKITIDLPVIGKTEFTIRPYVKALLENIPSPTLKLRFKARGNCDDFAAIKIENTFKEVIDSSGANFQVLGIGISYTYDAEIDDDDDPVIVKCKCKQRNGKQWQRTFHVEWYLDISMNPGIQGKYLIDDFDIVVSACCCCDLPSDEDNGSSGTGTDEGRRVLSQQQKRGKPVKLARGGRAGLA